MKMEETKIIAIIAFVIFSITFLIIVFFVYELFPNLLIRSFFFLLIFYNLLLYPSGFMASVFDIRLSNWYLDHGFFDDQIRSLDVTMAHLLIRAGIWIVLLFVLSTEKIYLAIERIKQRFVDKLLLIKYRLTKIIEK